MKKIRGVWLTNVDSQVLNSQQNIVDAMQLLAETGFNTVFPVVWNGGYTLYPSQIMKDTFGLDIHPTFQGQGRDPLGEVIEAAKTVGLDVIPWFEYGFACSYNQNGGHILQKKPHWAAKDQNNQLLKKNNFEWMNAFDPEVQDFLLSLFIEVVQNYNVDGVQGDDRCPALPSEGGYDQKTKALYHQEFGVNPPLNTRDSRWMKWRANLLTDFLEKLYNQVKAIKPQLLISLSPSPYPFGYNQYLQDSPNWLKRSLVDIIHPQLYRKDLNVYEALVDDTVDRFSREDLTKLFPGVLVRIGNYHISPNDLWNSIRHNRRSGIRGEVLFFFEELRNNNNALAKFLQLKAYADYLYLRRGMWGDDVKEIQTLLAAKNYEVGPLDGDFGARTEAAVKAFQHDHGLSKDGIVGPQTYKALTTSSRGSRNPISPPVK